MSEMTVFDAEKNRLEERELKRESIRRVQQIEKDATEAALQWRRMARGRLRTAELAKERGDEETRERARYFAVLCFNAARGMEQAAKLAREILTEPWQ